MELYDSGRPDHCLWHRRSGRLAGHERRQVETTCPDSPENPGLLPRRLLAFPVGVTFDPTSAAGGVGPTSRYCPRASRVLVSTIQSRQPSCLADAYGAARLRKRREYSGVTPVGNPPDCAFYPRTKFLAKNSTFAGRSASRRIRYGYHSGPYGVATNTSYPSAANARCRVGRMPYSS